MEEREATESAPIYDALVCEQYEGEFPNQPLSPA